MVAAPLWDRARPYSGDGRPTDPSLQRLSHVVSPKHRLSPATMNAGYGGMPSRRKIRGPLHPPHRAPPTSGTTSSSHYEPHQDQPGPSTGQKRGWASIVRPGARGPLPSWEQPASTATPSATTTFSTSPSTAPAAAAQPPRGEFVFQSGLSMPLASHPSNSSSSNSSTNPCGNGNPARFSREESSSYSLSSSNSQMAFSSASGGSPASFRTAIELEPQVATHGTISSRGMPSAQQALLQEQRKTAGTGAVGGDAVDDHYDGPPSKRRRGLAGTIVDTALNAALYTGAAALTAYSLWSTWGKKPDGEDSEEPDGGRVLSAQKATPEKQLPPGGLEEQPPPYIVHDLAAGPSAPRSPASTLRKQRVFVSHLKNRRRPTFQSHRAIPPSGTQQRRAIPAAFMDPNSEPADQAAHASMMDDAIGKGTEARKDGGDEDEEDDDGMFQRFQDKMNVLIAQGQAALESTPTLDAMDFDQEDAGFAIGSTLSSSNSAPSLSAASVTGAGEQGYGADSADGVPHTYRAVSSSGYGSMAAAGRSGMVQSQSQPAALYSSQGSPAYLPEPIKRSYADSPKRGSPMSLMGNSRRYVSNLAGGGGPLTPVSIPFAPTASDRSSSPFATSAAEEGGNSTPGRLPTSRGSTTAAWQSPYTTQSPPGSSASGATPTRRASMLPRPSAALQARRATGYAPR